MHHLQGWLPHQTTAPNVIRHMLLVHQCQTHNNNLFHIISDDDDDDDTVVASNCSPRDPPPTLPTSDLRASQPRKRPMCQLVSHPRSPPATHQTSSLPASPPTRVLTSPATILATAPTAPHVPIHNLRPKPIEKPSKSPARTKPPTLLNRMTTVMRCPPRDHPRHHDDPPDSSPAKHPATFRAKPCTTSLALDTPMPQPTQTRPCLQNITSSIRDPSLTSKNTVMGWCMS